MTSMEGIRVSEMPEVKKKEDAPVVQVTRDLEPVSISDEQIEKEEQEARMAARARQGQMLLDKINTQMTAAQLKKLLRNMPSHVLDYQNDGECGPIHATCWHNIPHLARVLIDAGCDLEKRMHGLTPLMMACSVGSPEIVDMMLEAGAYVNAVSPRGDTAVSESLNYPNILRKILEAGGDRTIKKEGKTPLEQVREPGFMHADARSVSLQILREYDQIDLIRRVAERRANTPAMITNSPKLWEACKAGELAEVNRLLKEDADPLFFDEKKRSCLWIACRMGKAACATLLLQSEGALVDQTDEDGVTPLMAAAEKGKKDCVELCLDHGARINACSNKGFTPLVAAIYNRQANTANYLLERGARPDVKAQGKSALEWAKLVVRAAPSEAAKKLVATIEEFEAKEAEAQQSMAEVMSRSMGAQVQPSAEAMAIGR